MKVYMAICLLTVWLTNDFFLKAGEDLSLSGVDESETSQEDTSQRSMEDQVKTVSDQLHTGVKTP